MYLYFIIFPALYVLFKAGTQAYDNLYPAIGKRNCSRYVPISASRHACNATFQFTKAHPKYQNVLNINKVVLAEYVIIIIGYM